MEIEIITYDPVGNIVNRTTVDLPASTGGYKNRHSVCLIKDGKAECLSMIYDSDKPKVQIFGTAGEITVRRFPHVKSMEEAQSESTCQKRKVVCEIYDRDGNILARESNRCNPEGGTCHRLETTNTKSDYPVSSECNWSHAEVQAIRALPLWSKPYRSVLYGHTFYCGACEESLRTAGVEVLEIAAIGTKEEFEKEYTLHKGLVEHYKLDNKPEFQVYTGTIQKSDAFHTKEYWVVKPDGDMDIPGMRRGFLPIEPTSHIHPRYGETTDRKVRFEVRKVPGGPFIHYAFLIQPKRL